MVGREILTRTSTQTRGKAVRYGQGPRFPDKKGARQQQQPRPEPPEQLQLL
ncbi:hypothetical protein [Mycobacterium sp. NPDC050853]|uniref:hypothetical protein n=1 Tax=Mycobacterium sp. NPDC050853 TaxID=3155160 RepID=UPI0034067E22